MRKVNERIKEKIRGLYSEGLSIREISRRLEISYSTTWIYLRHESPKDYFRKRAEARGFSSWEAYLKTWLAAKGMSRSEYVMKKKKSRIYLRNVRKKLARKFGVIIKHKLKELGKSYGWLGVKTGISRNEIVKYARGEKLPREKNLEAIVRTLNLPTETIEMFNPLYYLLYYGPPPEDDFSLDSLLT